MRIQSFVAEVDQPGEKIAWTLSAQWTRYPDESDYAVIDYTLTPSENWAEGIQYWVLRGSIRAPSSAAANARLAVLKAAVSPAGFVTLNAETSERDVTSESTGGRGDSVTFVELSFSMQLRDPGSIACTIQRAGVNAPTLNLGTVDKCRDAFDTQLFDEMRDVRRRQSGRVAMAGKWYAADNLADASRQAALVTMLGQFRAELVQGVAVTLIYGTAFNARVRLTNFTAEINRLKNCIEWTLAGEFTRYPDEADYALLDYSLTPSENWAEGIPYWVLRGSIRAPSSAAANARLQVLLAATTPANYVTLNVQTSERGVASESTGGQGDGTAFIELTFSVQLRDPATLVCTFQLAQVNAPALDLGTVDKCRDIHENQLFDEMRDVRRRQAGRLALGGKWYAADSLSDADRQTALVARKAQLDAQLLQGAAGTLVYGAAFSARVRLTNFTAEINRLKNCIEWTLAAEFTRYPNEADYALLEYRVQTRRNQPENIWRVTITGKIQAPTAAAASNRLALLKTALVPAGYAIEVDESTPMTVGSESTGGQGDGSVFTELTFNLEARDTAGIVCTVQRPVANAPVVNLGTVDRFANRLNTTLFDDMRNQRRRAAGQLSLNGKWYAADSLSDEAKAAALTTQYNQMQAQLVQGVAMTLNYTGVFNAVVRVLDFDPHLNRLGNCIEWSLTANYTAFPNEADYATCEFKLGTRNNLMDGTIFKTITGEIWAPTPTAAQAKLARLRTTLIPAGYTLINDGTEESRVDVESDLASGTNTGEGPTFIRLTVNDEWQSTAAGNVLSYNYKISTDDDAKTAFQRITYTGSVTATAADQPTAFAAALAQAQTLAAGQYPFLLRSNVTENLKLFQTTGAAVFVTVDFAYEYQQKGVNIYLEVTSELSVDTFGQTVEVVSGYVAAPTLSQAQASYLQNVRNVATSTGALILTERTPTKAYQRLDSQSQNLAQLDDRFAFSLQLLRAKDATQTAIDYTLATDADVEALTLMSTVEGTVYASTEAVARAFLTTFLSTQSLPGNRKAYKRVPEYRSGPAIGGGAAASVFVGLKFVDVYEGALTGAAGILRSEIVMDLQYSGTRNVQKDIPDGPSIIQQVGITPARRTVQAHCVATTEAAAEAWIRTVRAALLSAVNGSTAAYEDPPKVQTKYIFLSQVAGVPVGAGANVNVYDKSATFAEIIPQLGFNP